MQSTTASASTELPPHAYSGLTADQVAERVAAGKVNSQRMETSRSVWAILSSHLFTVFNLVLGVCAAIVIMLGRWFDTLFVFAAVSNVVIGLIQEYSAKVKLDRIAVLNQDAINVIRDGEVIGIKIADIVVDDVIVLSRGDQLPADGVIISSDGLEIDEALLTGEADPIPKVTHDSAYSGSAVLSGNGTYLVTAVGADSHAAKITKEARKFSKINSELRGSLERVVKWITVALVPIIAIVLNSQMIARGGWAQAWQSGEWKDAAVSSVAAITAGIPQGLALMTTIAFALAALKLASKQVLIQEQPAVELLARVDTVCLDKTGTLTEGGVSFGEFHPVGEATLPARSVLGYIGADPHANPTAMALHDAFSNDLSDQPCRQIPFSSARRFSGVVYDRGPARGSWYLGAPEALLSADRDNNEVARAREFAQQGLRTMVLSYHPEEISEEQATNAYLPADLQTQAILTFTENVRSDAAETLKFFTQQGVDLKVISGDNPLTVAAVAREVGFQNAETGFDGRDLPTDKEELAEVMEAYSVFGRVSPDQKKAMVEALQSRKHVVAMTGDGVNDAMALKTADVGIAMGDAAPATKAVSRMVLLDNKFSRLPHVLSEGRQVIANTERLSNLFLTKTTFATFFALAFGALLWTFPFLPRQYSTIDFLILGAPAFFLAMLTNPRRYVPGFLGRALRFAIPSAFVVASAVVLVNTYAYKLKDSLTPTHGDYSLEQVQTASAVTVVLLGLWLLNVASRPLNAKKIILIVSLYVLLVLVLTVPISLFFHQFQLPDAPLWWAVGIVSTVGMAAIEGIHRWHRKKYPLAPLDPIVLDIEEAEETPTAKAG
ncbi:HAD-IC family P-type ATPase [Micrococcoides hystricis]|uniref:HAD-IC family P-type ATPase n=1 Tax=Micrococcoides hystricis TaxID=1572761 RepID=A0ABV6PCT1_9MICC